jgi:L-2,4-diaminobutyric acid acetyltransferase
MRIQISFKAANDMMTNSSTLRHATHSLSFRSALPTDGAALWRLVESTGALELNSAYFYVLFATDFGDTCLVAEDEEGMVGAVIGYHPPREPDTAFVWQIGILPERRGEGLGLRLLNSWLELPSNQKCRWLTATVADDNAASQALFRSLARERGAPCEVTPHFAASMFPHEHVAEPMFRIGPLARGALAGL